MSDSPKPSPELVAELLAGTRLEALNIPETTKLPAGFVEDATDSQPLDETCMKKLYADPTFQEVVRETTPRKLPTPLNPAQSLVARPAAAATPPPTV